MKSTYSIPFDITAPQAVWKAMVIDMPMTMAATSLRFAAQRLQAQADFLSSLTQCRSVTAAIDAQSTFAQAAVNDYTAGATKLMADAQQAILRKAA